jgi:hypothetical protein
MLEATPYQLGSWNKSSSSDAQYVSLEFLNLIGRIKVKTCQFGSTTPCIFAQFVEAGKRHSKLVYLLEECNKYDVTAAPCFLIRQS